MPSLGADMDRGTLLEWKVAPGDHIDKGDIVAVIDTEKSDIDVETFHAGVVVELLIAEGTEVEVGTPLAIIRHDDEAAEGAGVEPEPSVPAGADTTAATSAGDDTHDRADVLTSSRHATHVYSPIVRHLADERGIDLATVRGTGPGGAITRADLDAVAPPPGPSTAAPPAAVHAPPLVVPGSGGSGRPRSSPLARTRAAELGVDLAAVFGTGPGGAITVADVDAAARQGEPSPVPTFVPPPAAAPVSTPAVLADHSTDDRSATGRSATVRAATGRLMARSKREVPHYYLSTTIDLHAALDWLESVNRERPITERVLPAALLMRATVLALADQPRLNGWWVDDELRQHAQVDLGVGVALRGGGLIAPVVPAADQLDLDGTMDALRGIVGRARSGRLKGTDLGEATITITNLGDQGVDSVYGVIAPPQVAVVGFGAVSDRPWAVDGMLAVRPVVTATLSADHRATDGHEGARYLATLDRLLNEPETL